MGARIAGIIAAIVFVLAVVVYGSFAIYEGSWSLTAHNVKHGLEIQQQVANGQASIAANGWNYQSMLGQKIVTGIDAVNHDTTSIDQFRAAGDTVSVTDEMGQRASDAGQVCYDASQVNGVLPHGDPNTDWINKNCSGGVLSTSSIYYVH